MGVNVCVYKIDDGGNILYFVVECVFYFKIIWEVIKDVL